MPQFVDELIQEANALKGIAEKYSAQMTSAGFGEAELNKYTSAIVDLLAKDTTQKSAVENLRKKTATQNETMEAAMKLLRSVQNAARAAYGDGNITMLKEFHIGKERPHSVKQMTTELAFLKEIAVLHQTDLVKNGFSAEDTTLLDTITQSLTASDTSQENAKKAQVTATKHRDNAAEELKVWIKRVRNIAKVKFRDDPVVLSEFSSITARRNGVKEEAPATPPPVKPL